jgi:GNAT superfamily N-acetyltransferase
MLVREVYFEEIPEIIKNGKAFEEASREVVVDVEYATATFQKLVLEGLVTMLALVDDEGKRIGGLAYLKSPDLYSGKMTAVELYWFVFTDKRGCGKLLIDAFEESAKSKGCVRTAMIHLVDSYPETLRAFYEKRGYHLVEQQYVKEI